MRPQGCLLVLINAILCQCSGVVYLIGCLFLGFGCLHIAANVYQEDYDNDDDPDAGFFGAGAPPIRDFGKYGVLLLLYFWGWGLLVRSLGRGDELCLVVDFYEP